MKNVKYLGLILLFITGCQKEKSIINEDFDKEINLDSINSKCIPVSIDITDSEYNILGYSFDNSTNNYDLFDFQFVNLNLLTGEIDDTCIRHNQDENFRETPFKIKTNNEDVFMHGRYNHWDDFSGIYLFPYFICRSMEVGLKWEASIGNRRSLSNNFHILGNQIFLFTTSFPSDNDYFSLTTDILSVDGEIEESVKIDSVNILIQTSIQLSNKEFIIVGRTDWNEAKDIQLYSIDTLGKENWRETINIKHYVDFKSIIKVENSLLLSGNATDIELGLLYKYDLTNKTISIFSQNENYFNVDLISSDIYIYLLKGDRKDGIFINCYLDIYSISGELIRSVLLDKYNNTKSIAFNIDSHDNIVIIGDKNGKVHVTKLNSVGEIIE